jgi:lathosterol oxidase
VIVFPEINLLSLFSTFIALTAIIGIRYVVTSGLFFWFLWGRDQRKVQAIKLMERPLKPDQIRNEIRWSLIASAIYALPAAIVLELWQLGGTAIYNDLSSYPLWYLPLSIGVYLFLHDTYFYWIHRLMHVKALYPVMHRVHHQSIPNNPWASFSFHPWESIAGAVFIPILLLIVPIHVGGLMFILLIMTLNAVLNHSGYEIFPQWWLKGWLGRNLITAAHHDLHHKRYTCNYALYFRFWDKLMGTDILESEYEFLK